MLPKDDQPNEHDESTEMVDTSEDMQVPHPKHRTPPANISKMYSASSFARRP